MGATSAVSGPFEPTALPAYCEACDACELFVLVVLDADVRAQLRGLLRSDKRKGGSRGRALSCRPDFL